MVLLVVQILAQIPSTETLVLIHVNHVHHLAKHAQSRLPNAFLVNLALFMTE